MYFEEKSVKTWVVISDGRFGKKENDSIRFESVPQMSRFDSVRFDSLLCQNLHRQSTPGVLDSGLKRLDQSTEAMTGRPALQQSG